MGNLLPEDEEYLVDNSLSPWNSSRGKDTDIIRGKLDRVNINTEARQEEVHGARNGAVALDRSFMESHSPPLDDSKTGDLFVEGKVIKRIFRGRCLFQLSPK